MLLSRAYAGVHSGGHSGVLRACRYSWRVSVGGKWCLLQKLLHLTSVCFCKKKYSRGVWNHRIQGQEDLMWEWVKKWSDNSEPSVILQVSYVTVLHFWSCFCCCTIVIYSIVLELLLFYVSLLADILRMDVPDQNGWRIQTHSFLTQFGRPSLLQYHFCPQEGGIASAVNNTDLR